MLLSPGSSLGNFHPAWSAISGRRTAAMAAAASPGVGRRASIIHSVDNQKSWKHTFMRRAVPEGTGRARRTLYECRRIEAERQTEKRLQGASERVDGEVVTRRDEAERRNQGDKRRVGPVMYDAQIRAIVPITVQIIAHELVASGVAATPSNRLYPRRTDESWLSLGCGPVDDPSAMFAAECNPALAAVPG